MYDILNGDDPIDVLTDPYNLDKSMHMLMLSSGWKASTQRLYLNRFSVYEQVYEDFTSGKPYTMKKGHSFILNERGKRRYIQALHPYDMLIQHTLTNSILIPLLSPYLIHDNGASIKGKGISFTRKRFEQHLHAFYRKHGLDGYILKIDFRKYFDNIEHAKLIEILYKYIKHDRLLLIIARILDHYKIDVSYSDNLNILKEVFNSLEYNKISKSLLTGDRYMCKSLGIGSPVSQILGIFFPLRLDDYCKTVKGVKYYDAYMDDRIIIHHSKSYLKNLLNEIKEVANELGLIINTKKTMIFPIHKSFTFLKTRYKLTDTGKLIKRISPDMINRERRKLKSLSEFVISNNLDIDVFVNQYRSWRGGKDKEYKAYKQLKEIDDLYEKLLVDINKRPVVIEDIEPRWFDFNSVNMIGLAEC